MADPKIVPTVEFLRSCFRYDPQTGRFWWRARPADHFDDPRVFKRWTLYRAGREAFKPRGRRYCRAAVTYSGVEIELSAHRVAWALVTGRHPADQIDHINGDPHDNRFDNLREADQSRNNMNRKTNAKKRGGLKGTAQCAATGRWRAQICVDGSPVYLGRFETAEAAHAAYVAAAKQHFGAFARAA